LGTTYTSPTLATGFGSAFAQPLLREAYEERVEKGKRGEAEGELMTREEAEKVLDECMKVLFYRDARSLNKVSDEGTLRISRRGLITMMANSIKSPR
jgi:20S proteasome subunit beta 7